MIFNWNVTASNQMLLAELISLTVQRRENVKESYVRNWCKAIKTCNRVNMKCLHHSTTVFHTEYSPLKRGVTLLDTCFGLLLGSPPRSRPHTQQGFGIRVGSYHWAEATIVWDHKCLMVLNLKVSLSFPNTPWQSQNQTKDPAFTAGTCHRAWSIDLISRQ